MVDCERQLLASWINGYNLEHIKEFSYFSFYPEIYIAISEMPQNEINLMTVAKNSKTHVSEIAKLLTEYMPSMYDGAYKVMKEEKIKTMLAETAKNPTNIVEQIEAITKEIEKLQTSKIKKPTDLCNAYKQELERRKVSQPLKYGLPTLDYSTGGIRKQEFTVIAARPSVGKTALALQIAFDLALKDNKVLFFPLEMTGTQLMERIVCRFTDIKHEKLKTPQQLDIADNEKIEDFYGLYRATIKQYLGIVEGVSNLTEIKKHIEHYKPSVVIIDQLSQLKENKKFGSLRDQFVYMTNTVKTMAMNLDVPIILLAQIGRDAEGREPKLSDLKESGSIEEDADNVIMIHQLEEQIGDVTPMEIIIRKQRNGERDRRIPVAYLNKKFMFREVAK